MRGHRLTYGLSLFLGDLVVWYGALWVSLAIRYFDFPTWSDYVRHATPYTIIFVAWFLVAYIFGLYESRMVSMKTKLATTLFNAQFISAVTAIFFFYSIPFFGITPKVFLFINLVVSGIGMFCWRILGARNMGVRVRERAILIGAGDDTQRLFRLVNDAPYYPLCFAHYCDTKALSGAQVITWVKEFVKSGSAKVIVLDVRNESILAILPELYTLSFDGVHFVDQQVIHEDITESVPLSLLGYAWLVEHISRRAHVGYDTLKRMMDLVLAIPLFLITVPFYVLIIIAVRRDGGPAFFVQERVGKDNKRIFIAKFRTMTTMDAGIPLVPGDNRVTKVGKFLRKSRLDELPQLINVIAGDLSLIGPRPEVPGLVLKYNELIPYYNVRHFITPGLSGWAQVHHERPPQTVEETREKLAYDLYYLQHRSFMLDLKIALRTIHTLLSHVGA